MRGLFDFAVSAFLCFWTTSLAEAQDVWINEFHYDNAGTDLGEFIEVAYLTGKDVTGYQVVLYNGNGGAVYNTFSLTSADAMVDDEVTFAVLDLPTNGLQNGSPDGIALFDGDALVEFLSYEGAFTAVDGPASGLTSTDIGVSETFETSIGASLQRQGTGCQGADFTWLAFTSETKGALNTNQVIDCSGDPSTSPPTSSPLPLVVTLISEIQGAGDSSPLVSQDVKIRGIVVGDFQDGDSDTGRNLRGFFVQEEDADADGDPNTSEGIFVFDASTTDSPPNIDVNVGDLVEVVGTVSEFFDQTQIGSVVSIEVVSQGNALPTPTEIKLGDVAESTQSQDDDYQPDLEAYEGMLVAFPEDLMLVETFQLDRFNEVKLVAGDRPYQFTQLNTPDATAYDAYQESLGRRRITYDDGVNEQNFNIGNLDGFGPTYDTASSPRIGDTVQGLTGVLSYTWAGNRASGGTWRVRTNGQDPVVFAKTNPRPLQPPTVDNDGDKGQGFSKKNDRILKVVTVNVLNFFTTIDFPFGSCSTTELDNLCSGPNDDGPRGADDLTPFGVTPREAEFERQLEKLVNAFVMLDADIYSIQEIENEFLADQNGDGVFSARVLLDALNAMTGKTFAYVEPPTAFVGPQPISNAIIYNTEKFKVKGTVDIFDDPVGDFSRSAVTASFEVLSAPLIRRQDEDDSKKCITISSNHFKSKGSDCGDVGDPDPIPDDGTGSCNGTRTLFAQSLADHLASDPTGAGCAFVAISGDLNSYASEDPIIALEAAGFFNTLEKEDYTYVFDGQIGTLDYFLINDPKVVKVSKVWHINEDEPDALDYNLDFGKLPTYFDGSSPARHSDHSPIVTFLEFDA